MNAPAVVGVRTSRHAPLRFVRCDDEGLPVMTRVIVDDDGAAYLAYIALPASLLLAVPEGAVRGTVVAAELRSPRVASAVAELDRAALASISALASGKIETSSAHWSTDRADLELVVDLPPGAPIPAELMSLRDDLATQVRAVVRLRYADGSALCLTP